MAHETLLLKYKITRLHVMFLELSRNFNMLFFSYNLSFKVNIFYVKVGVICILLTHTPVTGTACIFLFIRGQK